MQQFTQYHLLNFNDDVVNARIASFMIHVVRPLEKDGEIYLSTADFDRICGTGRTNQALRSCLIKVASTNGKALPDGSPRPCKWALNEHNWKALIETKKVFAALAQKHAPQLDEIAKELIRVSKAAQQ